MTTNSVMEMSLRTDNELRDHSHTLLFNPLAIRQFESKRRVRSILCCELTHTHRKQQ